MSQQRLELTWIGKGIEPRLEPRILIEDPEKSFGDGQEQNMLISGDNLLALKALEQRFAGSIKCVAIDPPYNTGSAFEQYEDGLEHSLWLDLMSTRIKILHKLLSPEGSIWVCIDDNEAHYLKVMMDEIFGRQNFIASVIWEKSDSPRMDAVYFSARHDYILVYARNKERCMLNRDKSFELPSHYDKTDEKGRKYYLKPLRAMGGEDSRKDRPSMFYGLTAPDGTEVFPKRQDGSDGRWRWGKEKIVEEIDRVNWIKGRDGWTPYYRIYGDEDSSRPLETIWKHEEVGSNRTSKAEIKAIFGKKAFDTPKPEALMKRIIQAATNEGDYVLDSFLGSGTTAAVAHKLNRRWIGIELGEHSKTHCIPRLIQVVNGQDQGGISEEVGWKGGGGFRFYELAPSLLREDSYGNFIIDPEYNPVMLAAAMCKHEGFRFSPDDTSYWKQGRSTEKDYIFTTTNFLTIESLDTIHEQMLPDESLLICCRSFQEECERRFVNITVKKIPQMLLGKCEFGKEDYSLNIVNLPQEQEGNPTHMKRTPGQALQQKSRKSRGQAGEQLSII